MAPSRWRRSAESLINALYSRSPVELQNLAVSAYGLGVYRQRYRGAFEALLDEALQAAKASRARLRQIQAHRWSERIQPVLGGLPAYGNRPIRLDELEDVPILTKGQLRENLEDYLQRRRENLKVSKLIPPAPRERGFDS